MITIKAAPEYITGFFLVSVTEDQIMVATNTGTLAQDPLSAATNLDRTLIISVAYPGSGSVSQRYRPDSDPSIIKQK